MTFKITLEQLSKSKLLPINYQYPLSSVIYKILENADKKYAYFLHQKGYGKGFKYFTFSDLKTKYKINKDRLVLQEPIASFLVSFHLPEASKNFIIGLFKSKEIEIYDKKSSVAFKVKNVEALSNDFKDKKDNDIIDVDLKPYSPIVTGIKNTNNNYDFLSPIDEFFDENLIYNWRQKIEANYNVSTAEEALLIAKPIFDSKNSPKSRLITIKAGTPAETKIRGFLNFNLNVQAEKRFVEILQNCGAGLYNAQGMGFVQPIKTKQYD